MHSGPTRRLEKSERGNQAEQRPEGAEIPAPEPRGQPAEAKNPGEDQKGEESHVKNRLGIVPVGKIHPSHGLCDRTDEVEEEVQHGNQQRVEEKSVKPGQEGERVEEITQSEPGGEELINRINKNSLTLRQIFSFFSSNVRGRWPLTRGSRKSMAAPIGQT